MDKTKEYILMCEKAVEIQEEWTIKDNDYVYINAIDKRLRRVECHKWSFWFNYKCFTSSEKNRFINTCIWLPRQDQLQEIIGNEITKHKGKNYHTMAIIHSIFKYARYKFEFESTEQLCLSFIMSEKYNKIWNGKDWEK